jgi:hypothetical protein
MSLFLIMFIFVSIFEITIRFSRLNSTSPFDLALFDPNQPLLLLDYWLFLGFDSTQLQDLQRLGHCYRRWSHFKATPPHSDRTWFATTSSHRYPCKPVYPYRKLHWWGDHQSKTDSRTSARGTPPNPPWRGCMRLPNVQSRSSDRETCLFA